MTVLSIVTGTKGRPESFRRMLDSIRKHTTTEWELVVADANEKSYIETDGRIKVIPDFPPNGCSLGYNRAFHAATGKWVVWLNDDAEVLPGWDTAGIVFMEAHPEVGLGAYYWRDVNGPNIFSVRTYYGMPYANFGILSRELGETVGWFDAVNAPMYGNDNSMTFRVFLAGKGVACVPGGMILHHREQKERLNDPVIIRSQHEKFITAYRDKLPQMQITALKFAHLNRVMETNEKGEAHAQGAHRVRLGIPEAIRFT